MCWEYGRLHLALVEMKMIASCKAIKALERDGGWVGCFGSFGSEGDAWTAVTMFWDMMVNAEDYIS